MNEFSFLSYFLKIRLDERWRDDGEDRQEDKQRGQLRTRHRNTLQAQGPELSLAEGRQGTTRGRDQ